MKTSDVAKLLNITTRQLYYILDKNNIDVERDKQGRRVFTLDDVEKIKPYVVKDYSEGFVIQKIKKQLKRDVQLEFRIKRTEALLRLWRMKNPEDKAH